MTYFSFIPLLNSRSRSNINSQLSNSRSQLSDSQRESSTQSTERLQSQRSHRRFFIIFRPSISISTNDHTHSHSHSHSYNNNNNNNNNLVNNQHDNNSTFSPSLTSFNNKDRPNSAPIEDFNKQFIAIPINNNFNNRPISAQSDSGLFYYNSNNNYQNKAIVQQTFEGTIIKRKNKFEARIHPSNSNMNTIYIGKFKTHAKASRACDLMIAKMMNIHRIN